MAERITPQEKGEQLNDIEASAEKRGAIEQKLSQDAEKAAKEHSGEKIKAKKELEQAISGSEHAPRAAEKADKKLETPHKGIKKQEYKVTMRGVEARLPSYQRAFSKIIRNRIVDNVSNVASKTIARPSGLLGGAVASFVGLLVIYLNARRIGFEYPSGTAFIFFASVGWIAGILIEYLVVAFKKMKG